MVYFSTVKPKLLGGTPWWWTYISNGFRYAIFLQGDHQMQVVFRNATALLLDSDWFGKKTYWLTFNKLTCTAKQPDEDSLVHCCSPIWWSSSLASPVPAAPALQRGDLTTFWWPETKNSKATNQSAKLMVQWNNIAGVDFRPSDGTCWKTKKYASTSQNQQKRWMWTTIVSCMLTTTKTVKLKRALDFAAGAKPYSICHIAMS